MNKTEYIKSFDELPVILQPKDIINLGIFGETKVYEILQKGKIPQAKKIEGRWIIPKRGFIEWINEDKKYI